MVKKTPRQVAAMKKAKENKDTSEKLAMAIKLYPSSVFDSARDFELYKTLVKEGYSAKEAYKLTSDTMRRRRGLGAGTLLKMIEQEKKLGFE
jgi:hypothetical protein